MYESITPNRDKELQAILDEINPPKQESPRQTMLSAALEGLGSKSAATSATNVFSAPTSLSTGTQLSNLSQGLPANGVASSIDGGTILADGSTVTSGFDLGGIGSAGNHILPLAGLGLGYDAIKNKRRGARGVAQTTASGAMIGSEFGPWGALAGGVVGLGAGLLQAGKSTKEKQQDRWKGVGKEDFGMGLDGYDYGSKNADFARTRDEKFLTANDIRVNPDNYNNVSDWDTWDSKKQDLFLNDMLANGKVNEKKGGIYYDDKYAQEVANKIRSGQYQAPQANSLVKQLPGGPDSMNIGNLTKGDSTAKFNPQAMGNTPVIPRAGNAQNKTTEKIQKKFNNFGKGK